MEKSINSKTELTMLPQELKNNIEALEASITEIISHNPAKGRYTIRILYNDCDCILKWNDLAHVEHLKKLQQELRIYAIFENCNIYSFVPSIYKVKENYIIMEKLKGKSLRKILLQNKNVAEIRKILDNLSKTVIQMYQQNNLQETEQEYYNYKKEYKMYVNLILCSGPMGTFNNPFETKILEILAIWLFNRCGKLCLVPPENGTKTVHGDFHLNNLFVDTHKQIYILDWENVHKGNCYLEIAYMHAQICNLLKNNSEKNYLGKKIEEILNVLKLDKKSYYSHAVFFQLMISCNGRYASAYSKNKWLFINKIKLFFKSFGHIKGRNPKL